MVLVFRFVFGSQLFLPFKWSMKGKIRKILGERRYLPEGKNFEMRGEEKREREEGETLLCYDKAVIDIRDGRSVVTECRWCSGR